MRKLVFALVAVAASLTASAALPNNTWKGPDGGDFGTPGNWELEHVPTTEECALIPDTAGEALTIAVNGSYEIGCLEAAGSAKISPLTFRGTGTIRTGLGAQQPRLLRNRNVTLDGVTLDYHLYALLLYTSVTVRNGGKLTSDAAYLQLHQNACGITVEKDSTFEMTSTSSTGGCVYYNDANSPGTIVVNAGGAFTCGAIQPSTTSAGGTSEINIAVSNATLTVRRDLTFQNDSSLTVAGADGVVTVSGAATLNDETTLSLTGGKLSFAKAITDRRWIVEAHGTEIETTFAGNSSIDVIDDDHPELVIDTPVTALQGGIGIPCASGKVRSTGRYPLKVRNFYLSAAAADTVLDLPVTLVVGDWQLIRYSGSSSAAGARLVNVTGPLTIRPSAVSMDQKIPKTSYNYYTGDIVVDTRDWNDPSVPRAMALKGFGSKDYATLTVRGGGSLWLATTYSQDPLAAVSVEEGTTLTLGDAAAASGEYGSLNARVFRLGKDAVLNLNGGKTFVNASVWEIDPTATINVTVPEDFTGGGLRVFSDLTGKLPDSFADRIVLSGATAGCTARVLRGQLVVTKPVTAADGTYPYEWVSQSTASYVEFKNAENWYCGKAASDATATYAFGAVGTATTVWFHGLDPSGSTVGQILFRDTASESFRIYGWTITAAKRTAAGAESGFYSQSALPQLLESSGRQTDNNALCYTAEKGPLILGGTAFESARGPKSIMYLAGDIRVSGALVWPQLQLWRLANRNFAQTVGTRLTVLDGGSATFTNQVSMLNDGQQYNSIAVCAGGTLVFDGDATGYYQWKNSASKIDVDGTLDIRVPLRGGVDQVYGGAGTVKIAAFAPHTAAARIALADSVTVEPGGDWNTVCADADLPLTLRALATPTVKLAKDWTYGPASASATDASARAAVVERAATLTVDAGGHVATFADPVAGEGAIAIVNGTLELAGGVSGQTTVRVGESGKLALSGDLAPAALVMDGGTLSFTSPCAVTVPGSIDVGSMKMEFPSEDGYAGWTSVLVASEGITGTPVVKDMKFRTVAVAGGTALQAKRIGGLSVLIK